MVGAISFDRSTAGVTLIRSSGAAFDRIVLCHSMNPVAAAVTAARRPDRDCGGERCCWVSIVLLVQRSASGPARREIDLRYQ